MAERNTRRDTAALVLSKLAAGSLPTTQVKTVWAGKGNGRRCDGCDQPIKATEIENEVELGGAVILRLHAECFSIWQEALETPGHEISGGSARCWPPFFGVRIASQVALLTAVANARATAARTRALSRNVRETHRLIASGD